MEDRTVEYLEERHQSDGRLPRKAREREGGEKIPANWLSKSIPEQWSMIGFRHVVYPRCDSELFSRPSVSTALSGGQDNSWPKMPSYLGRLWECGV